MSYYEQVTVDFKRLDDEVWEEHYATDAYRPSLVNLYLADSEGSARRERISLFTSGKIVMLSKLSGRLLLPLGAIKRNALHQNFPNPFNPETWMLYELAEGTDVRLSIYDAQGWLIRTLDLGFQAAGSHRLKPKAAFWDGRNDLGEPVSSGVSFYQMQADDFSATRKMLILKSVVVRGVVNVRHFDGF